MKLLGIFLKHIFKPVSRISLSHFLSQYFFYKRYWYFHIPGSQTYMTYVHNILIF